MKSQHKSLYVSGSSWQCVEGDTPSFKDAEALEDIALVLQTLQKEMKSSVEQ